MTGQLKLIEHLIKTVLSTTRYYSFFLYGQCGIGKTVTTLTVIKQNVPQQEYIYQNGYTTPLSLYEFLYKNKDKKVIILDDMEGLFSNLKALALLKAAVWPVQGIRTIHYNSTTTYLEEQEIPKQFILNAKLIILCNIIPRITAPDIQALINRVLLYEISFSYE